jgi:putative nucleotidyltransferase with HDIG domain
VFNRETTGVTLNWNSIPQEILLKINVMLEELKRYDLNTYNHCVRVSQLSRFLAEAAELSEHEILLAQFSGLLHDVGKMKIPIEILNKPGKLKDDEYALVKKHALFSAELLEPFEDSPFFREVQLSVLHHHERVDGKGYPLGLETEQIPYTSRLILIVDTVDAMGQNRAYRKGLPVDVIHRELEKFSGTQFDAELVSIFVAAHKKLLNTQEGERAPVITLPRTSKVA